MADIYIRGKDGRPQLVGKTADPQLPGRVTALEERVDAIEATPGGVQLSDAVDSDSSTTAASSKAVKTAWDKASGAAATANAAQSAATAAKTAADTAQDTADTANAAAAAAQSRADSAYTEATKAASTSAAGRVQLSDAVDSDSSDTAATSKAAKTAYDKGVAAAEDASAAQAKADSAYTEATKAASTTQAGRVQLSDAVDSDSSDTAATSKAVKTLNDRIVTSATGGVTLRGTRTTGGIWTVTGLIVGKPLYILHSSLPDNSGDAYANFSALSGTNDAMISGPTIRYQVGRGRIGFPDVCIVVPTATEVSFEITSMVGAEGANFLRAYQ